MINLSHISDVISLKRQSNSNTDVSRKMIIIQACSQISYTTKVTFSKEMC